MKTTEKYSEKFDMTQIEKLTLLSYFTNINYKFVLSETNRF